MEVQPQEPNKLTEKEWNEIYNKLRLFAYRKYGRSIDLDEAIQDAIIDTLDGIRRWPPVDAQGQAKKISLFCFLCHTVRSKVSHMFEQQKRIVSLECILEEDEMQELLKRLSSITTDPMQGSDQQALYNELCRFIKNAACGDEVLERIADLLTKYPDLQPRDIAERLNLSEMEVRNAIKRLARRAKRMMDERSDIAHLVLMQLSFEQRASKDTGGKH